MSEAESTGVETSKSGDLPESRPPVASRPNPVSWIVKHAVVLGIALAALALFVAAAGFAADRWEFWFPRTTGTAPSLPPTPSTSRVTNAPIEEASTVDWVDGDCLVTTELGLRESLFIVTEATFDLVDCAKPHVLFVSTNEGCDDASTFRRVGAPNFRTRLVTAEYRDESTGSVKCLIGVNQGGRLEEVSWKLDDLGADMRWSALQLGACVPWESANFIVAAEQPLVCTPGLGLVFETQVEGAQTDYDLNAITDSVCGSLAADVASNIWRSQWLNVNVDGRTAYWCSVQL